MKGIKLTFKMNDHLGHKDQLLTADKTTVEARNAIPVGDTVTSFTDPRRIQMVEPFHLDGRTR